ncbi:SseB family protein [Gallaecimonas kandeliae]|uniref:SseB family protein n=1 Tax=Gallaecimonas kandeliae TaxID=3029055 RepID=UPI0026480F21|nr:SseB family protein [Gallaecimonas kandeliae]WKE66659.1 SseB family protein [Gallaecimonas kandeliae]
MIRRIQYIVYIILIFGVGEAMAQEESRIDVNQAVENPALVSAMDRVAREGSDEAKDELLKQLLQANYLAAMFTDGLKVSSDDGNQQTIEKGSTFGVLSAESAGKNYLVLFTDWKALGQYTDQKVSGWILPSRDVWSFALQGNTYDGVVINPAHNALPLERPMLEYLSHHASQLP